MTAVILAAGISSRLRPLTDRIPKALLPVGGKPLLQRTLEVLQHARLERVVIVTGYLHEKVNRFIHSLASPFPITCVRNHRYRFTDNNYSLWLAAPEVAGQELLILDSDVVFGADIIALLQNSPHENALVMRASDSLGDEEVKLELDPSGRVVRIGKEIDPMLAAGESLGIEKFSPAAAEELFTILAQRKDRIEFYEASFQGIIDRGVHIYAVDSGAFPCMEIDTLDDLKAAEELARTHLQ